MSRSPVPIGTGWAVVLAVSGITALFACAPTTDPVAQHHHLEIRELRFYPTDLNAQVGDTLTWTNADIVPHTVSSGAWRWESGELAAGESFSVVVDSVGAIPYHCRFHPGMTARVIVTDSESG